MKWDQIESKWALMTCRIRAEWGGEFVGAKGVSAQTLTRDDAAQPGTVDAGAFAIKETEFETSAK